MLRSFRQLKFFVLFFRYILDCRNYLYSLFDVLSVAVFVIRDIFAAEKPNRASSKSLSLCNKVFSLSLSVSVCLFISLSLTVSTCWARWGGAWMLDN